MPNYTELGFNKNMAKEGSFSGLNTDQEYLTDGTSGGFRSVYAYEIYFDTKVGGVHKLSTSTNYQSGFQLPSTGLGTVIDWFMPTPILFRCGDSQLHSEFRFSELENVTSQDHYTAIQGNSEYIQIGYQDGEFFKGLILDRDFPSGGEVAYFNGFKMYLGTVYGPVVIKDKTPESGVTGGELRFETADDYDSTYEYYYIKANEDDLVFGRAGQSDVVLASDGNVGIGNSAPARDLSVYRSGNTYIQIVNSTTGITASDGFQFVVNATGEAFLIQRENQPMYFHTNDTAHLELQADGDFVTKRVFPVDDDTHDLGAATKRWDDVYATNGTIQTSDKRQKEKIKDSDLGLDFINSLRAVRFLRKKGKRTHYGLIAQEVESVLDGKDFAGLIYDKDSDQYGLRYEEFIGPMIKAIQELSDEIRK